MNAVKIWVHWNGTFTKLTLTSENTEWNPIILRTGGRTEEGYHREEQVLWLEDGTIFCHYSSDGRDCDGRYSGDQLSSCPVGLAHAREVQLPETEETYQMPEWEKVNSSQRDYAAEAAGY